MRQIADDLSGGALSLDNQVNACLEMRYIVAEFCGKHDIDMTDLRIPGFGTTGHPAQLASYSNVHGWLSRVKERLLEYVKAVDRTGGARGVALAKKYIDEHYRRELSLTEVADEVNLSHFISVICSSGMRA